MPTIVDSSEGREGVGRIRSQGGRPVFEETYTYIVEADNILQTRAEILLNTPGLPRVNETVGPFGFSICRSVSATRRTEKALYWDVTAEFSSEVEEGGDQSNGQPNADPTAWVPVYETKFERYQEVVSQDLNEVTIANSVGQPFETGLTITRHIPIWEFYQFEDASVDDETVIARSETVNENEFKGRAEKTLLCVVLSSTLGFYYGQRRRLTLYHLKYNSRNWQHKRLDGGTVYLGSGNPPPLEPYLDKNDNIIFGPLDGFGNKTVPPAPPAVLKFDIYPTSDFDFLRI